MSEAMTIDDLVRQVNSWCSCHRVRPINGQAGERLSERNVRYYRTLGLVDAPICGGGAGYGERHLLQLVALRILQAYGLPLNRIHSLLFGRTIEELREIQTRGVAELTQSSTANFHVTDGENWRMTPIDEDFLLVSRKGVGISDEVRARLRAALHPKHESDRKLGNKTTQERK